MSDIQPTTLSALRSNEGAKSLSTGENLWRVSLEKEILKKNLMKHIDHTSSRSKDGDNSYESKRRKASDNHSFDRSPAKEVVAESNRASHRLVDSNSKRNGNSRLIVEKTTIDFNKNLQAVLEKNSKRDAGIDKLKQSDNLTHTWKKTTVENKQLLLKILPDGEVLIRNYFNSTPDLKKVHHLAQSMKDLFGRDIEKIKLNGAVIWQQPQKPNIVYRDGHVINLIY